jgi:hypothetical protein
MLEIVSFKVTVVSAVFVKLESLEIRRMLVQRDGAFLTALEARAFNVLLLPLPVKVYQQSSDAQLKDGQGSSEISRMHVLK